MERDREVVVQHRSVARRVQVLEERVREARRIVERLVEQHRRSNHGGSDSPCCAFCTSTRSVETLLDVEQ